MPAIYMMNTEAQGIAVEYGWTKRFEAMGLERETAEIMAAALPSMIGTRGAKGSSSGNKANNQPKINANQIKENVAVSSKGNQSSNFKEHISKEMELSKKWNDSNEAHNAFNYSRLKDGLATKNLDDLAKQDPRLNIAINGGDGRKYYGIGSGTIEEANRLGQIWVGDGAKKTSQGGWISADGTRGYRPPSAKDSPYATTGIQANFETYKYDSNGKRVLIRNGHLNVFGD
jgi:filamentous hemagglutinin